MEDNAGMTGPSGASVSYESAMPDYTFPSVLNYLQSEWRRFERERSEWEIEKAEIKVC
jgi:hypothetical protein